MKSLSKTVTQVACAASDAVEKGVQNFQVCSIAINVTSFSACVVFSHRHRRRKLLAQRIGSISGFRDSIKSMSLEVC